MKAFRPLAERLCDLCSRAAVGAECFVGFIGEYKGQSALTEGLHEIIGVDVVHHKGG